MARMITAPGIIRHIDKYTNTMRKLQFSIAVGDWTESSGVYTAEWLNDYITASSFEIATYDHTLRDNGKGDIELEKKRGGGGLVFTTNALPTGTITGIVYVFDTQDGKLPVLLEDGTVEIEQGGTGATTAAGALANFGLDNAEHAQEALGFGDAVQMGVANSLATSQEGYVLDARQGKALNDTLNSKLTVSNITPTNILSGITNNLNIKKVSNVIIVSGYLKLPAGTYSDQTAFMKIPQMPAYNVFAFDNKNRIVRVDGTGSFFYHESQTLSSIEYVFFNFSYAV